jgi:ATP-dependent DNA helicase RecQ
MRARARYGLTDEALKNRELVLNLTNYDTKKSYDQSKLAMMLQYSETRGCRRKFILNYFGEDYAETCGQCDNCRRVASTAGDSRVTSGYRIADVVVHKKFGQGTVERAEKDLVTVLFPSVGYKTLLASSVMREAKIA